MDENDLNNAMREQVAAIKQGTAVNAAAIAQRNNEAIALQQRTERVDAHNRAVSLANMKTHAIVNSIKNRSDRPVEEIIDDAEKIYAWLISEFPSSEKDQA